MPGPCVCPYPQRPSDSLKLEVQEICETVIWILGNEPRSSGKAVRALPQLSHVSNLYPHSFLFLPFTPYISFLVFPHWITRPKTVCVCLVYRDIPVLGQCQNYYECSEINTSHIVQPVMYTVTTHVTHATTSFYWYGSYYYLHFTDK